MKVTVETLPQSLWRRHYLLLVRIVSEKLRRGLGTRGRLINLGSHSYGGNVHGEVFSVESAAEGTGAGVGGGGAHNA
jgi:hypothetical protein